MQINTWSCYLPRIRTPFRQLNSRQFIRRVIATLR